MNARIASGIEQFTGRISPDLVMLDLKPGTKLMTYTLSRLARPSNWLLNLEVRIPRWTQQSRNRRWNGGRQGCEFWPFGVIASNNQAYLLCVRRLAIKSSSCPPWSPDGKWVIQDGPRCSDRRGTVMQAQFHVRVQPPASTLAHRFRPYPHEHCRNNRNWPRAHKTQLCIR